MMNGSRVKILQASVGKGNVSFACADEFISFSKLQREGKGAMDAPTFLRGFPNPVLG